MADKLSATVARCNFSRRHRFGMIDAMKTCRWIPVLLCLPLLALASAADGDGTNGKRDVVLTPSANLGSAAPRRISALRYWQGAWWACSERGDLPVLYRSETPGFEQGRPFLIPDAENKGWTALCVLDDDLLIGDLGDRHREREDLRLYRARYRDGNLELAATYRVAFPDGRHDAAAAEVIDGVLHVMTRARGDEATRLYRFAELDTGVVNVAEPVGLLNLSGDAPRRESLTAAVWCAAASRLVVMSRTRLHVFGEDRLKPLWSTRYYAGLCEALALDGDAALLANSEGALFRIEDFLKSPIREALPETPQLSLPLVREAFTPDGTGEAWQARGRPIKLAGVGEGEYLRWLIAGSNLMLAGRLSYEGAFTSSSEDGPRRGSALILCVARKATDHLLAENGKAATHARLWLGDNGLTGLDVWQLRDDMGLRPLRGVASAGVVHAGWFTFEYAIPLVSLFGEGPVPEEFRVNFRGYGLKHREVHLTGLSLGNIEYPFTWAPVRVAHE